MAFVGRLPGAGTMNLATGVAKVELIAWYFVLAVPHKLPVISILTGTVGTPVALRPYMGSVEHPLPS